MSWAMRRRLIIVALIALVIAAFLGGFYFLSVHRAPSCTDNKQNEGETGVDCGGPCAYRCSETEAVPSVQFVRALAPSSGRTDVIAYVDNANANVAAHNVPYTIELYGSTNVLIAKKDGTVDLPPDSTVPVYVPDFFSGSEQVAHVFLTFNAPEHMWYTYTAPIVTPTTEGTIYTADPTPRITSTAVNPSATELDAVVFVITVFDEQGNAMAASQTLATLPPQGTAQLVYTWPSAFPSTVGKIEITPIIPLTQFPS